MSPPPHHSTPEPLPASISLDAPNEGILPIDCDNRLSGINRPLERLPGTYRSILHGSGADRFVHRYLPYITDKTSAEEIAASFPTQPDIPILAYTIRSPGDREPLPDAGNRNAGAPDTPSGNAGRVRGEERCQSDTEKLNLLLRNARDIVYRIDLIPERRFSYVSPAATAITGYTPEEHYADPDLGIKMVHPDDLLLLDAIATGEIPQDRPLTLRWLRKDGTVIWTEQQNVPIYNENGMLIAIEGIARDVTERKQMEEALRESEESYRTIVETASEGIWEQDSQHITLRVNPTMAAMLGYRVDEMVGRPVQEYLFEEDIEELHTALQAQRREGLRGKYECRLKHRDGTARWVLVSATPKRDKNGNFAGSFAMFTDITERRRAEKALKEHAERYQQFFNNPLVGYALCRIITDEHGNPVDFVYLEINQAFEDLTGLKRETVLNKRVTEILVPEEVVEITQRYGKVALTGESTTFHYPIPSLSKWFEIAVFSPQHGHFIAFFTDITDRKRVEEALRRRTDDLVRTSREVEAARDEANLYLDIITHDIRNANTVSSMYADLLVELVDEDLTAYAEKLHDSVERSSEILTNVATIRRARQETGDLVPVSLDTVIRDEMRNFPGASIQYEDPHVEVLADALLPVIFTNLIGNAVKFGGADVRVTIRALERDGEVLVSVEDTGPGVPDEVKGKLFTRFERGMGRGSGQGLGLFIVRTLVERYGGRVWIEDRVAGHPEQGAAFRFTLRQADHGTA
ncbi:PAS domain-containing sensor histidine kinase [Methanoculleus taiwanensis]|uniref:PAS domain-containing sensor histidine kinase n=1 Tax=Methanoculleus taiwanensis TaxID=1550565 RepID=UPI000FFF5F3A|nr:PAS domain-containing sensor histidine kinase [Methanoculleus taiwanensis]